MISENTLRIKKIIDKLDTIEIFPISDDFFKNIIVENNNEWGAQGRTFTDQKYQTNRTNRMVEGILPCESRCIHTITYPSSYTPTFEEKLNEFKENLIKFQGLPKEELVKIGFVVD